MGKRRSVKEAPSPRARWRWAVVGAVGLVAAGVGTFWWRSELPAASGGTPRLVVDRAELNLGYLPFGTPARAVFTLTNAGDGALKLADVPRVQVVTGC